MFKSSYKRFLIFILDILVVNMALYASIYLQYHSVFENSSIDILVISPVFITVVSVVIYYLFGLYSMLWRYASIEELLKVFLATLCSVLLQIPFALFFEVSLPVTVYFIYWMLTLILVGGIRLSCRIMNKVHLFRKPRYRKKRLMIIGAGEAASIIIKEIKNNPQSTYDPVIALDDDPLKHKTQINGVPVVMAQNKIRQIAKEMSVEEIVIAIPSIPRKRMMELVQICKKTGCKLKVIPSVYGIVNGEVSIHKIREVSIEDLLPRDEISLSTEEISGYLKGETILVTGGGGSIGSELCRQIATYQPGKLLLFDIYENNVYDLQNELLQQYKETLDIQVIIGSVRDKLRLEYVFETYKPSIVFHAAAHKHVPLMEDNPQEAIKNNILGTLNVAETSVEFHVKKFVLISTDKAVNPTSIMGATKRAAEMIIQYMNGKSSTKFGAVRFGNVLGSNGSVIPLFQKQIAYGGPITITHPDVIRYFMTIPEAASLVIQAGAMMDGGEIFVLDMGEQVKIVDLAKTLITLSGLEPDVDIEIQFIGLRPGEKLYEELLISDGMNITKNNKIFIEQPEHIDLDWYMRNIKNLQNQELEDKEEVFSFIRTLIPSYQGTII